MIMRRLAALASAPLLLVGCQGNDAEQAVKDVAGVQEGTNTRAADVDEKTYQVEEVRRIIDTETREVVGREVSTTDVTVQEQTKIEREVNVESSETTTQTEGHVPNALKDQ